MTEWVNGGHLSALPEVDGLRMTRMAVEACTASLVLTGYVHADPHEGNLMLSEDGRIVFLDFGLMSTVDDNIMEAFARGIQACLAEDWATLAVCFKETGFVNDPIQYKEEGSQFFTPFGIDEKTGEDLGLTKFSNELGEAMRSTEGGTSRFGALATVLNQVLAPRWKMFTPPYVLLLIRTFLTLEGIAARVDPEFNIYEMAMPWAVRRSLSPSSADGKKMMRSTLLKPDNRVQWERVLELASESSTSDDPNSKAATPTTAEAAAAVAEAEEKRSQSEKAKAEAMNDAVGSLLGSPEGAALRRALRDVDSTDLIVRLMSRDARQLRHAAALAVSGALTSLIPRRGKKPKTMTNADVKSMVGTVVPTGGAAAAAQALEAKKEAADAARPISEAATQLRLKQDRWKRKVAMLLLATHLRRQLEKGKQGVLALFSLFYLSLRIAVGAVRQAVLRGVAKAVQLLPGGGNGGGAGGGCIAPP